MSGEVHIRRIVQRRAELYGNPLPSRLSPHLSHAPNPDTPAAQLPDIVALSADAVRGCALNTHFIPKQRADGMQGRRCREVRCGVFFAND